VELLGKESVAFAAEFEKMMKKKESFALMVGEDLYYHDKAEDLAKLVALAEYACDFDLVIIPPKANALGVALICDLDDTATGYTVGYNEKGDYRLSALGDGDLDMPALNQQEGTLTTLGKRVVPTNAALEYEGYELNDLAREILGMCEQTIDWTEKLPATKGFRQIAFDALPNTYLNDGTDNRGYQLEIRVNEAPLPVPETPETYSVLEGEIVCRCNPPRQFSDFSDKAHQIFESFALYTSPSKAAALGERVELVFAERTLTLSVVADDKMEGEIMCVPDFKSQEDIYGLFGENRYYTVTLRKG